ncbi:MAG TPA: Ig-like domain repeat protein [Ktedonobacterales bacterium]
MSNRHHPTRFILTLCWMLLTCGVGMGVLHSAALAAAPALPPGYALSVTESASTMTYGSTAPDVQAQLTVPAGDNPLTNPAQFTFQIDTQSFIPDSNGSNGSTYTFNLKGRSISATHTFAVGQHTVVANYFSIVLNQTLSSAPITLTVQKLTPNVSCDIAFTYTFATNASVTFTMSAGNGNSSPAVDWQNATYSVTFLGSQNFTDTNLTANSSGQGTALTPSAPGRYKYQCTFSGTQNFSAAQTAVSASTLTVSASHQSVTKLYSNPTTITGGTTATLEIVVSGGSGLPAPTGQVSLGMGGILYTKPINLGARGSVVFQIAFPQGLPANTIWVNYLGDTVYAASNVNFPLTNPPLPTGSNPSTPTPHPTGTSAASSPTGTAVALTQTPSSSPASSSTITANGGTTAGSPPAATTSIQGNTLFWVVLMGLLVLAGGSGVFLVLRRRALAARASATVTTPWEEDW